MVCHRRMPWC
ncbi:MAG: hypothetical protein GTN84_13195 [Hydrogenophaga sp.]|nr:hypothetical protein [Hydrogenophaga sp.]NIN27235.1 hypothetical protein [Hydrogenophaga sp.]NIN31936.1 hypothetical protein [Hydrogenophaga sp.]NIN56329.1 hypothetical protein [Hydrogenophaga sp.]NIO52309.1 hypothetical protein [Hydrogenophaga sp.]